MSRSGTRTARQVSWGAVTPAFALPMAALAQAERLPLVAVVALAVGVGSFLGRSRKPPQLVTTIHYPAASPWYVGDRVLLTLAVRNSGAATTPAVTVSLAARGVELSLYPIPELRAGEACQVDQTVLLSGRRGATPIGHAVLRHHRLVGPGRVLPPIRDGLRLPIVRPRPDLPPARVVDLLTRVSDEGVGSGRRGGADPLLLRPFAGGDPVSSVHWRSTARAGVPIVMEREQLTSGTLVLLVALGGEGAAWEAAVARAAGVVQAAASAGVPVQVVAAAPAEALGGWPTHEGVQDWLAGLESAGAVEQAQVLDAQRRAGGGLIAVLSDEPRLAAAVARETDPRSSVLDLATPW